MTSVEAQNFMLRSNTQRGRVLAVSYTRENGIADLTISADGRRLFSGRVLGQFAGILHTVSQMEESASTAKAEGDMMKYYGCTYIARFSRAQLASRLNIPELAEYD